MAGQACYRIAVLLKFHAGNEREVATMNDGGGCRGEEALRKEVTERSTGDGHVLDRFEVAQLSI